MGDVIRRAPEGLTCRELADQLLDWFGGEVDAELGLALEGHCQRCPDCEHMRATYAGTVRLTERLFRRTLSAEQLQALEGALLRGLDHPAGEPGSER